jgi:phosphoenolpyruvate synthase/pyruvate phosphate dikinase
VRGTAGGKDLRIQEFPAPDPALTGHNAANLARLLAHGLPVPAGLVLTAPACREIQDAVVRIIRSEADFGRLRPGDVLVCPTTSPAWSVVFPHAGALVTEFGGTLSHAAIIAREFGIPAVLSTHDGTRRLREGQVVTVDGTVGAVRVASCDPVAPRLGQLP